MFDKILIFPIILFLLGLPATVSADYFDGPQDGMFYIERKPAVTFKATLSENWGFPHMSDGILNVFAPVPPKLPGQGKISAKLFISGNDRIQAEELTEASSSKRRMLGLHVRSIEMPDQRQLKFPPDDN